MLTIGDPNPEITALREFVKVMKPLESMFTMYNLEGNSYRNRLYATSMLTALQTAELTLQAIDEIVLNFHLEQEAIKIEETLRSKS